MQIQMICACLLSSEILSAASRKVAGLLAGPATGRQLGARGGWSWETNSTARYPVSLVADLVPRDLSSVK